jgi:D-alanyl-D-alanine carboxypeptidase
MNIQKVWSDCLPASTVEDYVSIMEKLNSKTYFEANVYKYLDPVMQSVIENAENQSWLKHCGMKGGSTASVLTKAVYATYKDGNTFELA